MVEDASSVLGSADRGYRAGLLLIEWKSGISSDLTPPLQIALWLVPLEMKIFIKKLIVRKLTTTIFFIIVKSAGFTCILADL